MTKFRQRRVYLVCLAMNTPTSCSEAVSMPCASSIARATSWMVLDSEQSAMAYRSGGSGNRDRGHELAITSAGSLWQETPNNNAIVNIITINGKSHLTCFEVDDIAARWRYFLKISLVFDLITFKFPRPRNNKTSKLESRCRGSWCEYKWRVRISL